MTQGRYRGRIAQRLEGGLAAIAIAAFRRPAWALGACVVFTGLALFEASTLRIDPDLAHLLPASFRSVQDLEILRQRFGGVGYICPVLLDAEPEVLERAADAIAAKLETLPVIKYVDVRRPTAFFRDRALYFVEEADLKEIRERLEARERWERERANPMFVDLEEEPAPSLDFSGLRGRYSDRGDLTWIQAQTHSDYYIDANKRILVMLAKPNAAWSDLGRAREVVDEVKAAVASVDLKAFSPSLKVAYTGVYARRVEQNDRVQADLKLCSLLSLLLVSMFYALHFRRVAAVAFILVPMTMGLVWTYGLAGWWFGTLNILSAFIGAILLGLGDHGIHLFSRFDEEIGGGRDPETAVRVAFGETGRAVIVASMTSMVGFAGISISAFRAFREFGLLAATGMLLVAVAYLVCLPALLAVAVRMGWKARGHVPPRPDALMRWLTRFSRHVIVASVVCMILAVIGISAVRFNYDSKALEDSALPSYELDAEVNRLLGYQQHPVVVITDNLAEERAAAEALRALQHQQGDESRIAFVAASADMVPEGQLAKRESIAAIGRILDRVKPGWLEPEQRALLATAQRMTRTPPFGRQDLPTEVLRQFQASDASDQGFLLVFPNFLSDGRRLREFSRDLRSIHLPDGRPITATGEPMIFADIIGMVTDEAAPVLGLTIGLIFAALVVLLGSLRQAVLNIIPAVMTLTLSLGLMPLLGLQLNYLNILLIPVLFGLSIDGGAHITTRLAHGARLEDVLGETGSAVAGTVLTNALGFGALLVAAHPGLDSLGTLAVLGFAINLVVCLVALPAVVAWRGRHIVED